MEKYNFLVNPLTSYNKKREILYILGKSPPFTLSAESLKTHEQLFSKDLNLSFTPTSMSSCDDFLSIQDSQSICAFDLESETFLGQISFGSRILTTHWHPLSDRALGILRSDCTLSILTFPNKSADFTYNFHPLTPCSFCFFPEKPKSLLRFGCAILTPNGEIFALSPAIPRSLIINKDFLKFSSYLWMPKNSYVRYEPQVKDWFDAVKERVLPESLAWSKVYVEEFQYEKPVRRGPCFVAGMVCEEIQVVNPAHPCVLAIRAGTRLLFLVAAGDMVPSFSEGPSSIEWNLFEELKLSRDAKVYCSDVLILHSDRTLSKIEIPWLPVMKESYKLQRSLKSIPSSVLNELRSNVDISSICVISKGIHKTLLCSCKTGITEINLKVAVSLHEEIDRGLLETQIAQPQKINLPKIAPIIKASYDLPAFEGEEKELVHLTSVLDKFLKEKALPLDGKLESIREKIEENLMKNEHFSKQFEVLRKKVQQIEEFNKKIGEKITGVERNDEMIKERIRDVVDIQQNTKRPLTPAEKELSARLSYFESVSQRLKGSAMEAMKQFYDGQAFFKNLKGPDCKNEEIFTELSGLSFRLEEISSMINNHKGK